MSSVTPSANPDLAPDPLLAEIARYTITPESLLSAEAYTTAYLCLLDALGCGLLALSYPECAKLMGPVVPGAQLPGVGARVPGTPFELDPIQAAWCIGAQVRWLDFNDTWLAAEWGHPSDNLGAILAVADYESRRRLAIGQSPYSVRDVLTAMIQAYEIQGILALANSFNRVGLDHVLLVRIASTAVATRLLGGTETDIIAALSQAFLDGGALRTYRHSPNTGPRKSWAAGDATSRAVRLALLTLKGEMGYPTALSAPGWGFQDVLFGKQPVTLARPLGSYVMENILFKIAFPAEFHAQTAVEAAFSLYPQVRDRWDDISRIEITTHESAIRIIDKRGPLHNPADRDHCLQYMTAVGLRKGKLTAEDYEDAAAVDPMIDSLREKMVVTEDPAYSRDYLDPEKRSIPNAVQVFFSDGTATERVVVEYPLGHRRRREEAVPLLLDKFAANVRTRYGNRQSESLLNLCKDADQLAITPVSEFMAQLAL